MGDLLARLGGFKEKRVVGWGEDLDSNKVLYAINFRSTEDFSEHEEPKMDFFLFSSEDSRNREFVDKMFKEWRNGGRVKFPDCHSHIVFDLAVSAIFPISARIDNDGFASKEAKRRQAEYASRQLVRTIYSEIEHIETRIKAASSFDKNILVAAKTLAGRIKEYKKRGDEGSTFDFLTAKYAAMLYSELNPLIEILLNKRTEHFERIDKENAKQLAILEPLLKKCRYEAQNSVQFSETFNQLKEAQNRLKDAKIKREDRDRLWSDLQESFALLNQRRNDDRLLFEKEASANYGKLSKLVDELTSVVENTSEWKDVRARIIEAQKQLKEVKLKKDQAAKLREALQGAFSVLNERQARSIRKWEAACSENYNSLSFHVGKAVSLSFETTDWKNARSSFKELQTRIKEAVLKREQRTELFGRMQSAFEELGSRQSAQRTVYERECSENARRLSVLVDKGWEVARGSGDIKESREELKNLQKQISEIRPTRKEDRDETYASFNHIFERLQERANKYYQQKQREHEKRQEEWRDKQRNFIAGKERHINKLHEMIEGKKDYIQRQERNYDNVPENRFASENRASFRDKIDSANQQLRELESSLSDAKSKLYEARQRLNNS